MSEKFENIKHLLALRREALVASFSSGETEGFEARNTRIVDDYFCESFEQSVVGPRIGIDKHPYAIFALGGYGRSELSIRSDIDLLFLFKKSIPAGAEALIREMIYPLWDIGLEVGYATRSLKECIQLAGSDYEILTSLLDARFVCGMSPLFREIKEQLQKKIIRRKGRKIIDWLIENGRSRHQIYGDSAYLLEPNLKEGQGGLRDYHTLLWIARIKSDIAEPRDLERCGYLSHDEYEDLKTARAFVWEVRNHLHHMSGRKSDQLHFEYQKKLAEKIGSEPDGQLQPVEQFLGLLHRHMESIKQPYLALIHELERTEKSGRKKGLTAASRLRGVEIRKDALQFVSAESILESPEILACIFEEGARLNLPVGTESRRLVRQFSALVGRRLKTSADAVRSFERVLLNPAGFEALNEMLMTGFLESFLPEIKTVVNRIQYDAYHIYPVARHLLQTVKTIQRFGALPDRGDEPFYPLLYGEIKKKKLLLWAALLHDLGKGAPAEDHALAGAGLAQTILTEKGLKPKDIESVCFLIREHLLLRETATRRDINDEETAIGCARQVGDIERLKMLYLLSVADAMSTGPLAWNDWAEALFRNFFLKVLRILERGELASRQAVVVAEKKRARVLDSAGDSAGRASRDALFNVLSPRYIQDLPAGDIVEHMALHDRLGQEAFVWDVASARETDTRTVTICAKDRPGLFSKIAGVFTLNGIDVLAAQVYTWRNNVALDIFKVNPPPDQIFETERWARARKDLQAALAGSLDVRAAIEKKCSTRGKATAPLSGRPQKVIVDNHSSSFFTIVEVFAYEFPGLLFAVTDKLLELKLDIWVAKIASKVDQVVDVFYVRDFDGQKVDLPEQIKKITAALEDVLSRNERARIATGTYS